MLISIYFKMRKSLLILATLLTMGCVGIVRAQSSDFLLNVTPDDNGPIEFELSACNQTQTRPLVIRNTSDETISGIIRSETDATIELGNRISSSPYFNPVFVKNYIYAQDLMGNKQLVKLDANTWKEIKRVSYSYKIYSIAYDGETLWASTENGKIIALDANLNPTGISFETGYEEQVIVYTGTELLTIVFDNDKKEIRVLAIDTNGNIITDYGTLPQDGVSEICLFDPTTQTLWFAGESSYAYNLVNGKFVNSAHFQSVYPNMKIVAGFGNNGKTYVILVEISSSLEFGLYEDCKILPFGKGFSPSHTYIDLQPGEQTTINITAEATYGSQSTQIEAYSPASDVSYFRRTIDLSVDTDIEYTTSNTAFSVYTGLYVIDTVWLKNTGCQNIVIPSEPTLQSNTFFYNMGVVPSDFDGNLYNGDSVGCVVRYTLSTAGIKVTDVLKVPLEEGNILIELEGTAKTLDYSIAKNTVNATVTDCGTLTIADKITSNVPLTITNGTNIYTFTTYSGEYGNEMSWKLINADGEIVYSANSISSYDVQTTTLTLPNSSYTIEMQDSWGDGWDNGDGYINVTTFDGDNLILSATVSDLEASATFDVNFWSTSIAANTNPENLVIPTDALNTSGTTNLYVFIDGLEDPASNITLNTTGGHAEMAVDDAFNFGEQFKDHESSTEFIIANNGCGILEISKIEINNTGASTNFYFDEESYEDVSIKPNSTARYKLYFEPDALGDFAGSIVITTAEGIKTVAVSGTGIAQPTAELEYDYYADEIKDTIKCSYNGAVIIKNTINNTGTGILKVSEPIEIRFIPGTKGYCYFYLFDSNNRYLYYNDSYSTNVGFSSYEQNAYYALADGRYKAQIYNYDCDGTINIISNGKTLLTINLIDDNNDEYYFTLNAADIVTHTIAAGGSKILQMKAFPNKSTFTSNQTFYYNLITNDPDNKNITMYGIVRVVRAPDLAHPKTIDFGEVAQNHYVGGWLNSVIDNTGCGEYGIDNHWIVESGKPFNCITYSDGNLWFEPTQVGEFTATLKVAWYYNTNVNIKDTFAITLKGKCIAPPEVVFNDETLEVTAQPDDETVTVTTSFGNSGESALLLTDVTKAYLLGNTGYGSNYSKIYWEVQRKNEYGDWIVVKFVNEGYYTSAGKSIIENLGFLPAGHYRLVMDYYNSSTPVYGWNGGYLTIETEDGVKLLDETRVSSTNTNAYTEFDIAERKTVSVAPGGQADVDITIPVKGYEAGTYYFYRRFITNDSYCYNVDVVTKVTVANVYAYDFNKTKVVFEPVHTGMKSFSSVTLRNRGSVPVISDNVIFKNGSDSKFVQYNSLSDTYICDSTTFKICFLGSDEAGTYRDTMYIIHDSEKTDTIALEATATETRVIAVSPVEPNGYYRAGDTININVVFDMPVELDTEGADSMKILLNTGKFAKLYYNENSTDKYALTFRYGVDKNDNVPVLDYKEDTVYRFGRYLTEVGNPSVVINSISMPKVGTFASAHKISLDNKAPQLIDSAFYVNIADFSLNMTIKFNEPVVGLNESCFNFTNATLKSLKTKNLTYYTANIELQPCVATEFTIKAHLKDLAGNPRIINETKTIPAIHNYTSTVIAPTCTEEGHTLLVCSVCKHEEKTAIVPATGHFVGEAVKENVVEATATKAGSYDDVVYCTVCGIELSRNHIDVPIKTSSTIADNASNVLIYVQDGTIVVELTEANGDEISVFDVNGRMIAKAQANSSRVIIKIPAAGIYMVNIGQATEKVVLP